MPSAKQGTFVYRALSLDDARAIASWRYPAPYDCYDCPPWAQMVEQDWALCDPDRRAAQFVGLFDPADQAGPIGFYRLRAFPEEARTILGCGLRPDSCGHGIGVTLVQRAVDDATTRWPGSPVELEVRPFNDRAIRLYTNLGFRMEPRTSSEPGGEPLLRMRYMPRLPREEV